MHNKDNCRITITSAELNEDIEKYVMTYRFNEIDEIMSFIDSVEKSEETRKDKS